MGLHGNTGGFVIQAVYACSILSCDTLMHTVILWHFKRTLTRHHAMLLAVPASRTVTIKFLLFVNDLVLLSLQQQKTDLIGRSHTMLVALPFFVLAQWGCPSIVEVLGCK